MLFSENIRISGGRITFSDKQGNKLSYDAAFKKAVNRFLNWSLDFDLFLLHFVSLHIPFWTIRKLAFQISGVKIGKGSVIHMGCKFFQPSNVVVGEDTIIGDRAFLDGRAKLKIGSHVDIASEVMIYNSEHDIESSKFDAREENVEINDYAFLGPRVIVLPGVRVGKGAILAAGAVVNKNVPDFTIVGGVPAKIIGERHLKELNYKLGRARLFQ